MLFPNGQQEAGAYGRVIALSGLPGKASFGRQLTVITGTAAAATDAPLVGHNNQRVAALVQNTGANSMVLSFGGTTSAGVTLAAGAAFQIDAYFPWCGPLTLLSAAGTTYTLIKISNQD